MWDTTVPMIALAMRAASLEALPAFALPERYGWRFYQPGDEREWARIETSAGEFPCREAGLLRFRQAFAGGALQERMLFLTDDGIPFATATAWHEKRGGGTAALGERRRRASGPGAFQGHRPSGDAKASRAWLFLRGAEHADRQLGGHQGLPPFGFRPLLRKDGELEGWKIVSEKTGIDFLRYL